MRDAKSVFDWYLFKVEFNARSTETTVGEVNPLLALHGTALPVARRSIASCRRGEKCLHGNGWRACSLKVAACDKPKNVVVHRLSPEPKEPTILHRGAA